MNRTKELDNVLITLQTLNKKKSNVTINDLDSELNFGDLRIKNALDYLIKKEFVTADSNAYNINLEGDFFIEKSPFFLKKRPFLYVKRTEQLKIFAVTVNSFALLTLSILSYNLSKEAKTKKQNEPIKKEIINDVVEKKLDTIKKK